MQAEGKILKEYNFTFTFCPKNKTHILIKCYGVSGAFILEKQVSGTQRKDLNRDITGCFSYLDVK